LVAVACFLPGRAKDLSAPPRKTLGEVKCEHLAPSDVLTGMKNEEQVTILYILANEYTTVSVGRTD
jgi:hypothetical protein